MAKSKQELFNNLQRLKEDDFKTFKWYLEQDDVLEGFEGIPNAQLENAARRDTVDLMVQKHQGHGALQLTKEILEKISRNDLVQRLQNSNQGPKDLKTQKIPKPECVQQLHMLNLQTHDAAKQKEQHERKKPELKSIQKYAVEVTLDPDTAHPNLILSDDGKQVHHGDVRKNLPDNPKRFNSCVNVLGKQSFSSGKIYFEVQVKGKTDWYLGVAKESISRKGPITLCPDNGYWTMWLRNGYQCIANRDHPVSLSLNQPLQKVGVFVNYEEGLVCFYDVDDADLLYAFTDCSFTEKLYPFFSPCTNDGGTNSAPLIISPVNHQLNLQTHDVGEQKEQYERKKADLKSIQQFAVEVTLDPDTAHPNLILSDDGKRVHHGDVRKNLPDNPKRFNSCVNVLGKQRFSSGKFYFEVQVKGKTAWTLGVAKLSISRKGPITLCPDNGYWTMWLRNGDQCIANNDHPFSLSLNQPPQKVGVFVDYEEGLVCFYDVDAADLLYTFTGCSFTEKLYPFFSPCTNDMGRNSSPLIISPVNPTD